MKHISTWCSLHAWQSILHLLKQLIWNYSLKRNCEILSWCYTGRSVVQWRQKIDETILWGKCICKTRRWCNHRGRQQCKSRWIPWFPPDLHVYWVLSTKFRRKFTQELWKWRSIVTGNESWFHHGSRNETNEHWIASSHFPTKEIASLGKVTTWVLWDAEFLEAGQAVRVMSKHFIKRSGSYIAPCHVQQLKEDICKTLSLIFALLLSLRVDEQMWGHKSQPDNFATICEITECNAVL